MQPPRTSRLNPTIGGYTASQLDDALRRSQRSDPLTVACRLLGIAVVYALLALAIMEGMSGAGLLLPLLVEALVVLWLGGALALTVVPCAAFRASAGRGPGILMASAVVIVAGYALLHGVPELRAGDSIDVTAILPWLYRHQLHWTLLAVIVGLMLSSVREVMTWRADGGVHGGVFVWTTLSFMATRIGLVLALGLFVALPALLIMASAHEPATTGSWLTPLASGSWAWGLWGGLLLLDLATLAVLTGMHRDLSKQPSTTASHTMPASLPVLLMSILSFGVLCSDAKAHPETGSWHVFRAQTAPWVEAATTLPPSRFGVGARIDLTPAAVHVSDVLTCMQPEQHTLTLPAQGLFQGALTDPVRQAQELGFAQDAIATLRIDCGNASIDLHFADADTMLLALDNRIYSATRASPDMGVSGTPEGAVQALLEVHFDGDLGFTLKTWANKRDALATDLNTAIDGYWKWLATDYPEDHVPPINGDPLTDSQEYPTRFSVRTAQVQGDSAVVEVDFADAWTRKRLRYALQRQGGRWLLSDVRYPHGGSFVQTLHERSP